MSQHIFRTARGDRAVEVVLGYGTPLAQYFLTVVKDVEVTDSDFSEERASGSSLDDYRAKLASPGSAVPESTSVGAHPDRESVVSDRLVLHVSDGSISPL